MDRLRLSPARKRFNRFIPCRADRWLRYLRYGVLAWVLYATFMTGKLAFVDVDPYFALFNFWTGEVAVSGLVILGVVILASLFVERPFCKYACPYGAVLGVHLRGRLPGAGHGGPDPGQAGDRAGGGGKENGMNPKSIPLKIDSLTLGLLVTVILFGGIGLSAALNAWNTTGSKVPAVYVRGEFAGTADPGDIRGSYTLADIERAFDIPVEVLARAFGAGSQADPGAYQLKNLEATYGTPMGPRAMAVRDWAQSKGLEFSGFRTALQEKVDALP